MATELKRMKLTSVDLVRAGANQEADIVLFKSAGPEVYHEALAKSVRSILDDPELEEAQRSEMLAKTVEEYRAALEEPEEPEEDDGETVTVEKEPDIDEIEEVEKAFTSEDNCDTIEEVQKFNPFHDALGRFASKNGFKTYSANPKMKAAQPSIIRSAQAGHGSTMNVHRESKGENIGQNYDWLETGKKPASVVSTPPAKPKKPKQQKPKPQPQPQPDPAAQKPKSNANESIEAMVKDVSLSSGQKLALQARDNDGHACDTKKIAEDYDGVHVEGKDISGSFDAQNYEGPGTAIDAVARAQGWDKAPPTVISDRDTFDKLCLQSGCVMMRTVHKNYENGMSAENVARETMTRSDVPLGGGGGTACGQGLYVVNTAIDLTKSSKAIAHDVSAGQSESFIYRGSDPYAKQMMMTVRPGSKIATPDEAVAMQKEFYALSSQERARFKGENGSDEYYDAYGAYIASKGYDGAKWFDGPDAYSTIYNKSALVIFSEVAEP